MAVNEKARQLAERAIEQGNGILRLEPAWVAREFLAPPGRRLGLPESQYNLGERGGICERWIASTTPAENRIKVPGEGLSYIAIESGERLALKDAVEAAGDIIMGQEYAHTHQGLERLAKILDYGERLPFHFHQMRQHAELVGFHSKEEAYYFPEGPDMGTSPETFFGVHPYIVEQDKQEILLPHLVEWKDDAILQHARGYRQYHGDGWHVPAGTPHATGSALTIELQEDSDVLAVLQARVEDKDISKELLFKDVRPEDREKYGERIVLDMINWEVSGDPYFYENRHMPPILIKEPRQEGGEEYWIFYNTTRFSGKKLVVPPGGSFQSRDNGVYDILVWAGQGEYGGIDVEGQNPDLDELLICHERAVQPLGVRNTGREDLVIFKFFGPDINPDVPMLPRYTG